MKNGLVIKSTGSWYYVKTEEGEILPCKIKGTYRMKGIRATNPVAVGDQVTFSLSDEGSGLISAIEDRKNYIIRRSANLSKAYQLIASNIDQAILMITLKQPKTHLEFIDRYLVSAEAFRIPTILFFNKCDLYSAEEKSEMQALMALYSGIGYKSISLSLKTHENLDEVRSILSKKVSVLSGNSGVGKSTLLNQLDPNLKVKTSKISDYHRSGKHTTTNAEMYFFESGTRIIDTPGIKGFGTVDITKEELFHFFPEIFSHSKKCKFHNCLHVNEPECAVLEAVMNQQISESRYRSYFALLADMEDKYRK